MCLLVQKIWIQRILDRFQDSSSANGSRMEKSKHNTEQYETNKSHFQIASEKILQWIWICYN